MAVGTYIELLEVARDALFALDPNGVVLSWNHGAELLYKFTPDEAIGRPLDELIVPPDERAALKVLLVDVREGPISRRLVRHSKHGDRLHVAMTMRWITTDSGPGYVAVSHHDVSSEIVRDEVLRVKSEFLSNMSHELRTPLNSIIGFAELMHKGKVGPMAAEHVEFLGDIATSARRLLGMVNDVLDLARLDAGSLTFEPTDVDLQKLAAELRDVIKGPLAAKQLKLSVEIDDGCDHVVADPARLKQALYAFVSHAAKHTPAQSKIALRCGTASDHEVRLAVCYDGSKMTELELRKVFLEFNEPQAGLGLALAQRIVEAHGGHVDATTSDNGNELVAVLRRR